MNGTAPASVRVNRKAARRVASGHPWIFSSDVLDRGGASSGDAVTVIDTDGRALGTAHYSSSSQISLRLLSHRVEPAGRAFLLARLTAAEEFRKRVVRDSDAYRVAHGEADSLPGLVVDRYGDYCTVQALDQGMDRMLPEIVQCLEELFAPKGIVARHDVAVRSREELPLESRVLAGEVTGPIPVQMNGFAWAVDLLEGQKTGVFLDQRENYLAAAKYGRGRTLDAFASTGGFALHLARTSESVEAVDSSAAALRTAEGNRDRNGLQNIEFREADVFELLANYNSGRRAFDTVVLDPPAFAKSRSNLGNAMRGYKDINLRALRLLPPGGILITCSCSHHVSEAALLEAVAEASLDAGKRLRILERRTQSADHPILLTVPETHYLKCLILEVLKP